MTDIKILANVSKYVSIAIIIVGLLYVGFLLYDKDVGIAQLVIGAGILLAIYFVWNEMKFKKQRHEAPWNFKEYKGE